MLCCLGLGMVDSVPGAKRRFLQACAKITRAVLLHAELTAWAASAVSPAVAGGCRSPGDCFPPCFPLQTVPNAALRPSIIHLFTVAGEMKFGILYNIDYRPEVHGSSASYYGQILDQIEIIEELGFRLGLVWGTSLRRVFLWRSRGDRHRGRRAHPPVAAGNRGLADSFASTRCAWPRNTRCSTCSATAAWNTESAAAF